MCLFSALANTVCPPDVSNIGQEIDRWRQIVGKEGTEFEAHRLGNELDRDAFDAFLQVASVWRFMDQPGAPRLIPAKDHHENWQTPGAAFAAFSRSGKLHPLAERYMRLAEAYRAGDPRKFNDLISEIRSDTTALAPRESLRAEMEWFFNRTRVFFRCAVLYVIVFLLICVSWLREDWRKWGTVAFGLLVCVFALHSAGIGIRMYIHGRPPVTNLYASAVFVGWSSVLLGIFLERFWREGMGAACASVTGFLALAISENLTNAGDSMEPLRAVLDSNFWLAVHVPTIAIGYAATFVAGFLGLLFVFRGFFTRSLSENTAASLERMTYGIVCFSLLFGFIGTVTGGIWADRSWGRFWGWDPKENGALLIVLWNASILHARRDGMIRRQGLMALAILGNCVTAWSWFGTNMLNVGLHSYGFMEKTFFWLISFWASQIFMAAVGILPLRMWESFRLNSSEKKND
jgi:ABC-type transport system involved in cytochrome c biogenesis permease subunit